MAAFAKSGGGYNPLFLGHRKRGYLQLGSAGLDHNRKTACGPSSGGCITPFKAADPRVPVLEAPDRERAEAVAVKQFALD
jgi:hypothetical protein